MFLFDVIAFQESKRETKEKLGPETLEHVSIMELEIFGIDGSSPRGVLETTQGLAVVQ